MAECLREIAELTSGPRVVLLGKQTDVVTKREQAVEHRARFRQAALQDEIVDQPEAAGEERALARRQPVRPFSGVIAIDEPARDEPPLDRAHGSNDPRIVWRQEADDWQQQKA